MDYREKLPPGLLLDDSYRIIRVVGSGGFGITYEAEDVRLGTAVAIKEYYPFDFGERTSTLSVRPKLPRHAETFAWGRSNFLQEARTLARFEHPSIVRVTRVFEAHSTAYMVMRFERGKSFETWLNELGRQPNQEELDRIVAPLLDALEVLHAASFLHRDIAPDNIVVRADGTPVLLDFGAARRAVAEMSRAMTGIVKAGYSPHEQYSSDSRLQGPWSDLYALGGTLYRAIAGRPPEEATLRVDEDRMPLAAAVGKDRYRPGFLAGIDACLKVRHSQRPRSVAELRPVLFGTDRLRILGDTLGRLRAGDKPKAVPASHGHPKTRPIEAPYDARVLLKSSYARWAFLVLGIAAVGGVYGQFVYLRAPTPSGGTVDQQAQRRSEDEAARRRAEDESARRRANEEAKRRADLDAEKRRKDAEDVAKREAEKSNAREEAAREVERRRKADEDERAGRKRADDDARIRHNEALARVERGKSLAAKGDHPGAIADYDEAIRLDPKLAAAYLQRGISLANTGDHTRAIVDYTEALALEPQSPVAYYARGFSRAEKGEHPQAIADYSEAIRQDPKLAQAYLRRGNSYEFQGDFDRAITDYDEVLRLEPQSPGAHYARGAAYGMKGNLDQAIADYSESIRLDPEGAAAHYRRGATFSMRGEYIKAIGDFNEALRLDPKAARAYWQRGVAYANTGQPALASSDYDEAIRLDPKLASAYLDRGNLFAGRGDHTRAIAEFDEAIRLEPTLADAYYARGMAYAKKGNRVRAVEDYRKALRLDPNHREARKELQGAAAR